MSACAPRRHRGDLPARPPARRGHARSLRAPDRRARRRRRSRRQPDAGCRLAALAGGPLPQRSARRRRAVHHRRGLAFGAGEWQRPVAQGREPGPLVLVEPPFAGSAFAVGGTSAAPSLTLVDGQDTYVFARAP